MDAIDDLLLGPLNLIDRIEGLFKAAKYMDTGYRLSMLRPDKGGRHTLPEVEQLLSKYGIAVYGRTYDSKQRYFSVKKRQARWAEYLLLHAGVELTSQTFDERNPDYVADKEPGYMPKPWSEG